MGLPRRSGIIRSLALLTLYLPLTVFAVDTWSYGGGKVGPGKWKELFASCAGQYQSPININTKDTEYDGSLNNLNVHMSGKTVGRMILIHNGHTLQVNTIGDYFVNGGGLPSNYKIVQFHLHWGRVNHRGSEHQMDGKAFPLELHVVTYDYMNHSNIVQAMKAPMGMAMLSSLFVITDQDNEALKPVIDAANDVKDPDERDTTAIVALRLQNLLPKSTHRYYRYNGSLTTPGCFESVIWTVFEEKQNISRKQLRKLREIFKPSPSHHDHHSHGNPKGPIGHKGREKLVDNYRPVQPLNGRKVVRSFPRSGEIPTAALKTEHGVWSYKGDGGPANWKSIMPAAGCDGRRQSPINIIESSTKYDSHLTEVDIHSPNPETSHKMTVLNNGHTIKVSMTPGNYYIRGGGFQDHSRYKVAQFHFHWGGEDNKGSEHRINGHAYPLELHIVTYDAKKYETIREAVTKQEGLAVLGVMYEVVHEDNEDLQPVLDVMDEVKDPEDEQEVIINGISLRDLLPADTTRYFRYNGSLTTPGCFESVVWTVFKTTQTLSHKQMREFREILQHNKHRDADDHKQSHTGGHHRHSPQARPATGDSERAKIAKILRERLFDNFRPVQPINNRTVLRSYMEITDDKKRHGGGHRHKWGYHGNNSPAHWSTLNAQCGGKQQSPINIERSKTEFNKDLNDFSFYDSPDRLSKMSLSNNGHTVKVSVKDGVHYVYGGGLPSTYETIQLHFHWGSQNSHGSEHKIDGKAFPLELHVVNYDSSKYSSILQAIDQPQGLAVLAALFVVSEEENKALQPIVNRLLSVLDPDMDVGEDGGEIDPVTIEGILPADTSRYYRYNGSLTTPGCFESVIWTVFEEKLHLSYSQMEIFREVLFPKDEDDEEEGHSTGHHGDTVLPSHHHSGGHGRPSDLGQNTGNITKTGHTSRRKMMDNFRPTQPLHGRKVWRSFRVPGDKDKKHGRPHHWGYEGKAAPDKWAILYPDQNCDGKHQSPIDIDRKKTEYDPNLRDINIWYDPPLPGSRMTMKNNGHTIKVNVQGKYFITGAGLTKVYKTVQFHFHWGGSTNMGSEHYVDGQPFPMELHIVNYDSETYATIQDAMVQPMGLAVFGVLYTLSSYDNPTLEPLIEALEHVEDPDEAIEAELTPVSVRQFLPVDRSRYFQYNGSLTTPGCFESVIWTVFEQPQTISERQLQRFWKMLQMGYENEEEDENKGSSYSNHKEVHGKHDDEVVVAEDSHHHPKETAKHKQHKSHIRTNHRPLQPLNDRMVYRSFQDLSASPSSRFTVSSGGMGTIAFSSRLETLVWICVASLLALL